LSIFTPPLHAEGESTAEPLAPQERFLAAKSALEEGDQARFLELAETLRDYSLYPYLRYWYLRDDLAGQQSDTLQTFFTRYRNLPLSPLLRSAWLRHLAGSERWQQYLAFYRGSNSAELRCYAQLAELRSGDPVAAWDGARQLWLVGTTQHPACDPLFAAWEEAGGISDALRWQRIELSMASGHSGLAGYLAEAFDEKERQWVTLWRQVDNRPERIRDESVLQQDNEHSRRIVLHGLQRLASEEPAAAAKLWQTLAGQYNFSAQARQRLIQTIALNFALDGDLRALIWFDQLPPTSLSATSHGWAVRAALRQEKWQAVLNWIERMPPVQRNAEPWRYWQARAHEALGQTQQAAAIYTALSHSRTYYGFLAADRTGNPYNLEHESLEISDEALEALQRKPALQRAHELYQLGLIRDARREWDGAVLKMSRSERLAAGKLAAHWQWHDRALLALAMADHFDDLAIRFPLAHHEAVMREAEVNGLDPAWVYAVARHESGFIPDVQSSAGALGLMQLMPGTGRNIAHQLNIEADRHTLLEPETNIRFGSHYLQQVQSRFDGNPVMATAAYNAGPHRVEQWKPLQGNMDADIWIDTMPYYETRQYVRRVMAYAVFYDQRLARPITPLHQRMPRISPQPAILSCDGCTPGEGDEG
ncbi:MAG: transglycosylase SLT domain-containing protein, partial [Gammaproteobacteria bacterium]|nr:transglycosylase SLT domain-containing protein [Gammaproteobacteria bacterium]